MEINNYDVMNANWDSLLKMFHEIEMGSKDSKERYLELISLASQRNLTSRQREGIIGRCNNAIAGTYGKTKTEANLNHKKTALERK